MDSRQDKQPEMPSQPYQTSQMAPGPPRQPQFPFPQQWPFPYYPYQPQQMSGLPLPSPKRKSRKSKRDRNEETVTRAVNQPTAPLPQPQQQQMSGAQPQNQENANNFPQRQFYQHPSQYYNDQILRNHRHKPSPEVIAQNAKRLKEFKRMRKKKKRREKRQKGLEAQQMQMQYPPHFPFPGHPMFMHPPHPMSLNLPGPPFGNPMMPMNMPQMPVNGRTGNPIKVERSATSEFRGVSWSKTDGGYLGRIWCRGKSEVVGVFTEELRAAVAVDERLLQLGVDDLNMLNFRTQLERDIALVILLNSHRNRQNMNPAESESVAQALLAMGHRGPINPPGMGSWPIEKELIGTAHKLLTKGVSRDNNGNPNDISVVLKNILKRSRHRRRIEVESPSQKPSSRQRKRFRMQEPVNMVGNTVTIQTKENGDQSTDGYDGDGEGLRSRKKRNNIQKIVITQNDSSTDQTQVETAKQQEETKTAPAETTNDKLATPENGSTTVTPPAASLHEEKVKTAEKDGTEA